MSSLAACVLSSESGSALSQSSGRAGTGTCYHRLIRHTRDGAGFTGLHTCTLHSPGTHGHKSDPRGRDDIRQWSQDSILNITQDDDEEENDASLIMVTVGAWMKGVRELRYVTKLTTDHQDTSDLDPSHVATWGPIIYHTQLTPDTSPDHRAEATSNPSQVRGIYHALVYLNIEENTFSDSE